VVTLLFIFLPQLKPVPPPAVTKGEIVSITAGDSTLATKSFTASVQIDGYKGRHCQLTVTLYDAQTGMSFGQPYVQPSGFTMTPEAETDRASTTIAVRVPKTGDYFLRFILKDDHGTELHRLDSAKFYALALPLP
jgi:hypothetical protein